MSDRLAQLIVDFWSEQSAEGDEAELDALPGRFDVLALETDGVIGERISGVASILLETHPVSMSLRPDDYFAALESVQRACDSAGVSVGIGTWS